MGGAPILEGFARFVRRTVKPYDIDANPFRWPLGNKRPFFPSHTLPASLNVVVFQSLVKLLVCSVQSKQGPFELESIREE